MLELEVVPERSLGCDEWEFVLGMHISQAIAIIQSQVGIIKEVEVLYSDTDPLEVDVVINMTQDGIRLVFEPVVQRLKVIEISNMKLVKLKYCGNEFNSPEMVPSIEHIENSFGATHPGIYDAAKQLFALNFRGLSFYFPVDSKLQPDYAHGLGSLQFPSGSSPVVSKMAIYSGANITESHPPPLPVLCYDHHVYLESAKVLRNSKRTIGLHLEIFFEEQTDTFELQKRRLSRDICFGDSCQDVATSLGAPDMIYYKGEDKMKIHSPGAHQQVQTNRSDYFFNYFTLGIDVLFDAITKRCKKIILHTNYPGHYNFNIYHRCEFRLELPADKVVEGDPLDSPFIITAFSKWDDISSRITPAERPVVLRRAGLTNSENPFGSTFCFGYHDIIFEVMQNGHIAAVTLYSLSSLPKLCSETATNPKTSAKSKPSSSKEQSRPSSSKEQSRPSSSFECKPSCSYEQSKPSSSQVQSKPSTSTDQSNEKRKLSSTNEQSARSPSHERSKQSSNIEIIRLSENPECKPTLSNEQKKPSSSKEQLKLCSTNDRSKSPSSNEESTPSSNNEQSNPSPSHGQSKPSSSNQQIKRITEESTLSSDNEQTKPSPSHEQSKRSSSKQRIKRINEESTLSSDNEQSKPSPCHEQSKTSSKNERSKRVNEQSKTSSSNEESTPSSNNEQSKPSPSHGQSKQPSSNEQSKGINEQSKTSSSNEQSKPSPSHGQSNEQSKGINEQSKTSSSNEQSRGSSDPECKSGSSNQESKPEPSNEQRKSKSNKQNKGSSSKQNNKGSSSKQQNKSSRNQDSSSCT